MFSKLLDTASLLKAKIAKDNLDLALIEATNEDNWQASTNILHQISSSAYNHEKWDKIKEFVWDKLKNNKRWKKIVKALTIVQFLLKNGPQFASREMRREMHFFRTMQSFQAYQDSIDRGASIREKAKIIVNLLDNDDLLEQERQKAKQIREKMSKFSGNSSYSSETGKNQENNSGKNKYESYNNKQIENNFQASFGQRYNYGNYEQKPRINQNTTNKISKQQTTNSTKSYQIPKPIIYQPIIRVEQKRQNFETLSSKLRNPEKSTQKVPQVPDQSYKKKEVQDLLIDTQANFMEGRYHIHRQEHKYIQKVENQPTIPYFVQASVQTPVSVQKINVAPTKQATSLLTLDQSLNFLGIPSSTKGTLSRAPLQTSNQQQKLKPPIENSPPIFVTPASPLKQQPTIYNQPVTYSNQNYGGIPHQQSNNNEYYNFYNPAYHQQINHYQNPYNYYQHAQQYNNYTQYPNPYVYNPNPYNQPYNPYSVGYTQQIPPIYSASQPPSSITPSQSQQASVKAQETTQKDQFGEFKNGGSFQIDKINWMTSKEKNLTDLTDLAISPAAIRKQEKKQFGNNIKIDPWAW